MDYDVFISHSSKDKKTIARPLAKELTRYGLKVWLDEDQLEIGDSIRRSIDKALSNSKFGIIILSSSYLSSEWTGKELDALFSKETNYPNTILPILHKINIEEIKKFTPLLADKVSLNTDNDTTEDLALKITKKINNKDQGKLVEYKPENNHRLKLIFVLGLLFILFFVVYFLLESQNKNELHVSFLESGLDGFTVINDEKFGKVYPYGIKYNLAISHSHINRKTILINSIDIKATEISKKYRQCQKSPDISKLKGKGTVNPTLVRTRIYSGKIKTTIKTKDNKLIVVEGSNILDEESLLKVSDSDDDLEVIKGYTTLKNNGLYQVSYKLTYSIANRSSSEIIKEVYLCS